jgi:hypothetical protein
MKALLQTKKSPIAGAICELLKLYCRDLYEMHLHNIKYHRWNYDKELIQVLMVLREVNISLL